MLLGLKTGLPLNRRRLCFLEFAKSRTYLGSTRHLGDVRYFSSFHRVPVTVSPLIPRWCELFLQPVLSSPIIERSKAGPTVRVSNVHDATPAPEMTPDAFFFASREADALNF